jgi:predicted phage terminase large subunit-like protein
VSTPNTKNIALGNLDMQSARIDIERELGRRSMRAFVPMAFPVNEPSTRFIPNWHIDAICDHLEAAARGEIKKLAISIPSRHFKSGLVSVLWLPWIWTWNPGWRGVFASYTDRLAVRDSIKSKRVVESEWYRARWSGPSGWGIREDQNTQDAYTTTAGGHRIALSVGGRAIGEGGTSICVDDPQGLEGIASVYSKTERERVNRWWFETMSSRVDLATGIPPVFIMMQQRLHPEDLIGSAIARELGYEYLCLPSEFVPARKFITYRVDRSTGQRTKFWEDLRTKEGELLFPQVFNADALADARRTLRSVAYAAQHQQDPIATADSLFKPELWRFWRPEGRAAWNPDTGDAKGKPVRPVGCLDAEQSPAVPLPAKLDRMVVSVDCTLLGEASADWTVIQVWASKGPDRYLLEVHRGKYSFPQTIEILRGIAERLPFAKILVEESVVGPAVVATMKREVPGVVGVKTQGHGGKEGRAASVLMHFDGGNVFIPEGANWLDALVSEAAAFPKGRHDDQVDCMSFALRELVGNKGAGGLPAVGFQMDFGPGRSGGRAPMPLSTGGSSGGSFLRRDVATDFRRRFR